MQPQFKRKEETGADEKRGRSLPGRFLPSPQGEFGKRNCLRLHYLSAVFLRLVHSIISPEAKLNIVSLLTDLFSYKLANSNFICKQLLAIHTV